MLVGIDIVDIARIRRAVNRTSGFLKRVYTAQEIEYCYGKKDPFPSLAARFAAREAVRKLDQAFATGMGFHDTEIRIDAQGRPQLVLHADAMRRAQAAGIKDFAISLSHSREQAIAVVIASKE